jgi:hypothetical protein
MSFELVVEKPPELTKSNRHPFRFRSLRRSRVGAPRRSPRLYPHRLAQENIAFVQLDVAMAEPAVDGAPNDQPRREAFWTAEAFLTPREPDAQHQPDDREWHRNHGDAGHT